MMPSPVHLGKLRMAPPSSLPNHLGEGTGFFLALQSSKLLEAGIQDLSLLVPPARFNNGLEDILPHAAAQIELLLFPAPQLLGG